MSLKAPFSPHKNLFYRHASADFAERLSGTEKRTSTRFFCGSAQTRRAPLGRPFGYISAESTDLDQHLLYAEVLQQGFLTLALVITRTLLAFGG